jgi:hypothetical protein
MFIIVVIKALWMRMLQMIAAIVIPAWAGGVAADIELGTVRLDNWAYFQQNTNATGRV